MVKDANPVVVLTYATPFFNYGIAITAGDEILSAATVLKNLMTRLKVWKALDKLSSPYAVFAMYTSTFQYTFPKTTVTKDY